MNYVPKLNRRSFLITVAAAGGGLALGLDLPFGCKKAAAQATTPEIGAWVVIKPDDTVVIRVVRSEMGQGTVTGLCQLVAEELECNWDKVTWEYPTPGQSVARKARVGRLQNRRQPGHPHVSSVCACRWGRGPRNAQASSGQ